MRTLPRVTAPDSTLALLREGYEFIPRRCRRFHSDIFGARLLGERVLCMTGPEAAAVLYDADRFNRENAAPKRVLNSLFGQGGVQTLDGHAHEHRKAMFLSLMTRGSIEEFLQLFEDEWRAAVGRWSTEPAVVLHDEARLVLCRAACRWAGLVVEDSEARELAEDFGAMVSGFGSVGPRFWKARLARKRTERWGRAVVDRVRRAQTSQDDSERAVAVIARHRDLEGSLLSTEVASVELLNVLRPIVAVGRYIAYLALALWDFGGRRNPGHSGVEAFVQEVRRYYPFTPFVGARVRHRFEWRGVEFLPGTLVLLDIYGTNRDPRWWHEPEQFLPQRFARREPGAFDFMPQGGGDFATGHRCAGEWLTIEVMKRALVLLTESMRYDMPAQDLSIDLSEMPAGPKSGVVLRRVRAVGDQDAVSVPLRQQAAANVP